MGLRDFVEELTDPIDNRPAIVTGLFGVLIGLALGVFVWGPEKVEPEESAANTGQSPAQDRTEETASDRDISDEQSRVADALSRAGSAAEQRGGRVEAAVWLDGWPEPISLKADGPMRMWSLSKPLVAIAALTAAQESGQRPSPALNTALNDAITRSDNCAVRRVTLGLQELTGGTEGARNAFYEVLSRAGIDPGTVTQEQPPEDVCVPYLEENRGSLPDPRASAVLFGTAEWTIEDAVRFGHALQIGEYRDSGEDVLALMSKPKQESRTLGSDTEFTADPTFGAGRVASDLSGEVAYKGGWGGSGSEIDDFLVGQIVVADGYPVPAAIAVVFRPDETPPTDDPGRTNAPEALETFFRELGPAIGAAERESGDG